MKKIVLVFVTGCCCLLSFSQGINKVISVAEVSRIEKILSSDTMEGRKIFTAGIDKAGDFIAKEFAKNKLHFFEKNKTYFQDFWMVKTIPVLSLLVLDRDTITNDRYFINTTDSFINYNSLEGIETIRIGKATNFSKTIQQLLDTNKNLLVLIDTAHATSFKRLKKYLDRPHFTTAIHQVFILTTITAPHFFHLTVINSLVEKQLKNVIGILPGKRKKQEYVIFSSHYDHLGIGEPNAAKDSIYNGANDDASGTTAVIMLSRYFSQQKNNERTIIFVAFTAEETGGFGSQYFSKQLAANKIMAMCNIEMVGTESKWGTNSAYMTGFEKSDMGKILQSNLTGTNFHFEPDPYPTQKLFYRSDNATLAKLGVPAHTISTSKMHNEKYYHTPEDEVATLDMNNMAEIIKAIALSSKTIISGKDTPTRIKTER